MVSCIYNSGELRQAPAVWVLRAAGRGGGHLYAMTGLHEDPGTLLHHWETPQESRSQMPKRARTGWRLIAAVRDKWSHGHTCLKLTRQLLASIAL